MDTGHWKVYEAIPEDAFGFIYEITNLVNDKKYIGRKQMVKKIKRAPLKGKKRKRIDYVESDWKTYTGSSDRLNIDIATHGKDIFLFKIHSRDNFDNFISFSFCSVTLRPSLFIFVITPNKK